jgi:hypothetical protein
MPSAIRSDADEAAPRISLAIAAVNDAPLCLQLASGRPVAFTR